MHLQRNISKIVHVLSKKSNVLSNKLCTDKEVNVHFQGRVVGLSNK